MQLFYKCFGIFLLCKKRAIFHGKGSHCSKVVLN
jgi:hypothetical protein